MMLGMMEFHRRGRDDGFEGIVIVGQIGQDDAAAIVVGGCRGMRREVGRGRFGELSGKLGGMDVHRRGAESLLDYGCGGGRHGGGKKQEDFKILSELVCLSPKHKTAKIMLVDQDLGEE